MFAVTRKSYLLIGLLLRGVLSVAPAFAQQPGDGANVPESRWNLLSSTLAAPDRQLQRLANRGVTFQLQCVHDLSKAPMGAPGAQEWFSRYSSDVLATIDGKSAMHWAGGTIFLHGKQHKVTSGQAYDGVAQVYSNIDADSRTTLYEVWAQQSIFAEKLRVKAGRIDANSDFDVAATAADFLNSSMGYSPTILEFPSYPSPRFGADISASPRKQVKVSAGAFATTRGRIAVAEASRSWMTSSQRSGRAAFGVWKLREPITRFDGTQISGTNGYYGVVEQTIGQRVFAHDKAQNLAGYLQVGNGDGRSNPAVWHVGSGMVLTAPFEHRSTDAVGVATTWLRFTSAPMCAYDAHSELVLETYYKLNINHNVSLVTDAQYFHHPGGRLANPESFIVTPRLVMSF